ncbi:MAG: hypothetical protein RLP09_05710 [Sandaracinaceae bacterium]
MPNVKISELVGVATEADIDQDNDLLVVVDTSAAESKRVVPSELIKGGGGLHDDDFAGADPGHLHRTGAGAYRVVKSNLTATVAPTATDDDNAGYAVGSLWIDTVTDRVWVLVDPTPTAAVWMQVSVPTLQAVLDEGDTAVGSISLDGSITIGADALGFKGLVLWESAPGSEPLGVADRGRLYTTEDGDTFETELAYLDSAGNAVQLTKGGAVNAPPAPVSSVFGQTGAVTIADARAAVETLAGTSDTLADADNGKVVRCTNAGTVTVTVNTGLTPGTTVEYVQEGAGQVQVAAGAGMTLRHGATWNPYTAEQWSSLVVTILDTDEALVRGDLAAV